MGLATPKFDMQYSIEKYKYVLFDCDGVLMDSNRLKTQAFGLVADYFSPKHSKELMDYHSSRGGISRNEKFLYFFETILGQTNFQEDYEHALELYNQTVVQGLIEANLLPGVEALLDSCRDKVRIVLSGGNQEELHHVFQVRDLAERFRYIWGSPINKQEHLARAFEEGILETPAVFFGDSRYDYQAAQEFGLDFVFVSLKTEVEDWEGWTKKEKITVIRDFKEVVLCK
jgi:phosphoglycolate phosphatase-like HAD superfamily hydrolase